MYKPAFSNPYVFKRQLAKTARIISAGFLLGLVCFLIFRNYRDNSIVSLAGNIDQPIGQLKLVYSADIPGAVSLLSDSRKIPSSANKSSSPEEVKQVKQSHKLILPNESEITYAGLVWGGDYYSTGNNSITSMLPVKLTTPRGSYDISPDPEIASVKLTDSGQFYSRYADITEYVQNGAAGEYSVDELPNLDFDNRPIEATQGWSIVVAYQNPSLKMRHISVHVGNDFVDIGEQKELLKLTELKLDNNSGEPTSTLIIGDYGLSSSVSEEDLQVGCLNGDTKVEVTRNLSTKPDFANNGTNWNTTAFDLSGSLSNCKDSLIVKMKNDSPKLINNITSLTDIPSPNLKAFTDFSFEQIADQQVLTSRYSFVNLSEVEIRNLKLHEFVPVGAQLDLDSIKINEQTPNISASTNEIILGNLKSGDEVRVEFRTVLNPISLGKSITPQISFSYDLNKQFTNLKQILPEQSFKALLK